MNKKLKKILIALFWIVVWAGIAFIIASPVVLASPVEVAKSLIENVQDSNFWLTILICFVRIAIGLISACALGCGLAFLSYKFETFNDFIRPLIQLMKSAPIVCFIVLLLVWVGVGLVDIITVIIAVTPIYFFAIFEACKNRNQEIANMLKVYKVTSIIKWRVFEWPSVLPYFKQATQTGVGLSWKSGITAQMIGVVGLTIGERIYTSKLYLDTAQILLWMFIVILIGWLCEIIIINLVNKLSKTGQKRAITINSNVTKTKIEKDANLIIANICKTYEDKKVLDNVTYKINPGDRFALTGPTGSGKTTLVNIIMGIESADSGEIFINEYEPRTFSAAFQSNTLLGELSVEENISLVSNKKCKKELVDGSIFAKDLSGGMKRCAEIERAITADSQIVILDEPFTGLDDKTKTKAINYIDKNLNGRTLLLITHDKSDAIKLKCSIN